MSLPTSTDLITLDFSYLGQPFCETAVSASIDLNTLDFSYLGQPFERNPNGGTPSPPAAPTNLVAVAGDATVALTWTASSGATSYSVYRGTTSGMLSLLVSGVLVTSYTDNAVTNGVTYYYTVTATGAGGESAQSNEVSATPAAPPTPTATAAGPAYPSATNIFTPRFDAPGGPKHLASLHGERSKTAATPENTGKILAQMAIGRAEQYKAARRRRLVWQLLLED